MDKQKINESITAQIEQCDNEAIDRGFLHAAQVQLQAEREKLARDQADLYGQQSEFTAQKEKETKKLAEEILNHQENVRLFEIKMHDEQEKLEFESQRLRKKETLLEQERADFRRERVSLMNQAMEEIAEKKRKAFAEFEQEIMEEREKLAAQANTLEESWKELRGQQDLFLREQATSRKELLLELAEEKRKSLETLAGEMKVEYERVSGLLSGKFQEMWTLQANELEKRREENFRDLEVELAKRSAAVNQELESRIEEISKREEILAIREKEGREYSQKLQEMELALEVREKNLLMRQQNIEEEIKNQIGQTKLDLEAQIDVLTRHAAEQREHMRSAQEMLGKYEILKQELGGKDPAQVLADIQAQTLYINELRQKLITEPGESLRALAAEKEREIEYQKQRAEAAEDRLNQLAHLEERLYSQTVDLERKAAENERLRQNFEMLDLRHTELKNELRRYRAQVGEEVDRDARIAAIENNPYKMIPMRGDEIDFLDYDDPSAKTIDEINWLENIAAKCLEHGFKFPRRLLYAFHTSLKIAEWSPLTVLAGVSGTGKSELPRLYSLFGGLTFHSLPVQPNWDSQEAMLGFFNAIDNAFDAQPVLQLLAQTQKESTSESPYGLKNAVTLILLDEMNLAHMELYFADFLSKFESRRGLKRKVLPKINIKLGVNIAPYELPLGRNVLWAGTMNQDETTKSLSDKVLDRGIILHFPRPSTFHSRKELTPLPPHADKLLPFTVWQEWAPFKSRLAKEAIEPFKKFVEQINSHLETVGRALGHRVWQSMEYYMAAYPTVRKMLDSNECPQQSYEFRRELRIAFEDQLVQKVMPKLRGIETHGTARTHCLNKIRDMLTDQNYAIVDDFNKACEVGYGQFMWSSANYLNEEIEQEEQENI